MAHRMIEMRTWTVTEITLVADYVGHEPDTITTPCRSLSLSPPRPKKRSGAGGSIQDSIVEPPVISAVGVDGSAIRSLTWSPNRLTFRDAITGTKESFESDGFP